MKKVLLFFPLCFIVKYFYVGPFHSGKLLPNLKIPDQILTFQLNTAFYGPENFVCHPKMLF